MLRIVHFSDILAGNEDAADVSAALGSKGLTRNVDYIVVAGNVTVDGSMASFAAAEEILKKYANELLVRDVDGLRLNRVLIVPGQRDAADPVRLEAFQQFHDSFFADEIRARRVEPFEPHAPIIRELKDLTFVGLSYWRSRPEDTIQSTADDVNRALKAETLKRRMVPMAYVKRPPTLVVSAANLGTTSAACAAQIFAGIQSRLKSDVRTTVHLFGRGGSLVFPSPVGLGHPGFGTGERTRTAWPFVANVIELGSRAPDRGKTKKLLKCSVYRKLASDAPLELLKPSPWIDGHLDRVLKSRVQPRTQRYEIFKDILHILEEEFRPESHRYVIIRGFPGAGRETFYDFIKSRDRLIKKKIHVIAFQLKEYANFSSRFAEAQEAFYKLGLKDVMPILVLHDLRLASLKLAPLNELRAMLDQDGKDPCTIMPELGGVVLLLPAIDVSLGEAPDSNTRKINLEPRGKVIELIKEYADRVPASEEHLLKLTDGYTSFTEKILKHAAADFTHLPGSEPITSERIARLVGNAVVTNDELLAESRYHKDGYVTRNNGKEIVKIITDKVRAAGEDVLFTELPDIHVTVAEVQSRNPQKGRVRADLDELMGYGLLARLPDGNAYKVRVLAPFLSAEPALEQESWPPVEDEDFKPPVDFLIITAQSGARDAVVSKLENAIRVERSGQSARSYDVSKVPVSGGSTPRFYRVAVADLAGMDQVDAALAVADASAVWRPRVVMLVGIASGFAASGVALGDVLVPREFVHLAKTTGEGVGFESKRFAADASMLNGIDNFPRAAGASMVRAKRPAGGGPKVHSEPIGLGDAAALVENATYAKELMGSEIGTWSVAMTALKAQRSRELVMVGGVAELADAKADPQSTLQWREYAYDVAAAYAIAFLRTGPLPPPPPPKPLVRGPLPGGTANVY